MTAVGLEDPEHSLCQCTDSGDDYVIFPWSLRTPEDERSLASGLASLPFLIHPPFCFSSDKHTEILGDFILKENAIEKEQNKAEGKQMLPKTRGEA